jgi:hypothetical protein
MIEMTEVQKIEQAARIEEARFQKAVAVLRSAIPDEVRRTLGALVPEIAHAVLQQLRAQALRDEKCPLCGKLRG